MDIYVLNTDFSIIGIIDQYKSLIWTTRYFDTGDFELYAPATDYIINLIKIDNYIQREDNTADLMIIEKIEIRTDVINGNYIIATGRNLTSILDRRIIWPQQNLNGRTEAKLYNLVNAMCGNAADQYRQFNNFKTAALKGYTETINTQVTGDNLLTFIDEVCKSSNYGYKIEYLNNKLQFELYKGQLLNYIYFSPEYDNLINSDYAISTTNYKNTAYVAGEGEGIDRKYWAGSGTESLNRREVFIDARDLSSNNGEILEDDYILLLSQKGNEKLAETVLYQDFTGNVLTNMYQYKTDYNIGDIVTVENEYKITGTARIVEIIESWDADTGYSIVPTFEEWSV